MRKKTKRPKGPLSQFFLRLFCFSEASCPRLGLSQKPARPSKEANGCSVLSFFAGCVHLGLKGNITRQSDVLGGLAILTQLQMHTFARRQQKGWLEAPQKAAPPDANPLWSLERLACSTSGLTWMRRTRLPCPAIGNRLSSNPCIASHTHLRAVHKYWGSLLKDSDLPAQSGSVVEGRVVEFRQLSRLVSHVALAPFAKRWMWLLHPNGVWPYVAAFL